jgi:hypothetical protein
MWTAPLATDAQFRAAGFTAALIEDWFQRNMEQEKQHAIDTAPARVPVETAPETASGEAGVETVLGPQTVVGVRAHGTSMKQRR